MQKQERIEASVLVPFLCVDQPDRGSQHRSRSTAKRKQLWPSIQVFVFSMDHLPGSEKHPLEVGDHPLGLLLHSLVVVEERCPYLSSNKIVADHQSTVQASRAGP